MQVMRVFSESLLQAIDQLRSNKLRTLLSLMGITIGIFCIISVKSAVDSLEADIRASFEKLGNDVLYVSRESWAEDPGQNWWKYVKRPNPNFKDFQALQKNLSPKGHQVSLTYFLGNNIIKYNSSYVNNAFTMAVSEAYGDVFNLQFDSGRYFSDMEMQSGAFVAMIGKDLSELLFGDEDPVGREIKFRGISHTIIGVLKKDGKNLINIISFDKVILLPMKTAQRMFALGNNTVYQASIAIKSNQLVLLDDLVEESRSILRRTRYLKPLEEDNFSLNKITLLSQLLDRFFSVLNLSGFIIGVFSIIVGIFSVANIMFVSVLERTPMIGIKKALGAQYGTILSEFLIESIILCCLGGILGLLFVFIVIYLLNLVSELYIFLSLENILLGILSSVIIGILSGILPAMQAARMDPIEAMRN